MMQVKKISVVICCYNEVTNLPTVIEAIHKNIATAYDYEIIVVNDGSRDGSQDILEDLSSKDDKLFYVEFSKNFGHQNALKAGFDYSTGDCVISLDADMQHPPGMLPDLIKKWEEGYDIVYTRRQDDPSLGSFKRMSSGLFYQFMNAVSDIKIEKGTADFRLMNRAAANVLVNIQGGNLFIRGIVTWMGFKQYAIDYMPDERLSGTSKFTLKKMMSMAASGIISFSTKPLHVALYVGFVISLLSLLFIPYALISFYTGEASSGWGSLILTVAFLGGLQLFILGIIGLYIGRIFFQVRGYPPYIVRKTNIK